MGSLGLCITPFPLGCRASSSCEHSTTVRPSLLLLGVLAPLSPALTLLFAPSLTGRRACLQARLFYSRAYLSRFNVLLVCTGAAALSCAALQ